MYLGLRDEDYHYFAVYMHELPLLWGGEVDHGLRTFRRNLHNGRTCFVLGISEDDGEASFYTATWGVLEQVKDLLGRRGGFLAAIFKYLQFACVCVCVRALSSPTPCSHQVQRIRGSEFERGGPSV